MKYIAISGHVIHGAKRGRDMGFPTANIALGEEYKDIDNGVYAAKLVIDNIYYDGVANIGIHPTVGALNNKQLEVHIFNFTSIIYDKEIFIELIQFIRPEKSFNNIIELKEQIFSDINTAKEIIKKHKNHEE